MPEVCSHVNQIKFTRIDKRVCEDCSKIGDTWVHLRLCRPLHQTVESLSVEEFTPDDGKAREWILESVQML